ncbi:hypothetical protein AC1031_017530 [Aphanomyces cochlioides]|nr:hypothetical protein AC1031_017530 [Aphanomyces cochlioides]
MSILRAYESTPKVSSFLKISLWVPLYDDNEVAKLSEKEKDAGKQAAKESTAHYIRDQAMARGRRKATDSSDVSDIEANPSKKKKFIMDFAEMEMHAEEKRLIFEQMKFERELSEREKDREECRQEREERKQEREERLKSLELERNRNDDMMALLRHILGSLDRAKQ